MAFSLDISHRAQKALDKLGDKTIKKIYSHLVELKRDPYRPRSTADIVKIRGDRVPPAYRLRIGNLRIEYTVVEEENSITITRVFKRRRDSDYR